MKDKAILIPLYLVFILQSSFAQINTTTSTTTSLDKLDNTTTGGGIVIEDSIVGEKLEQVQNQSNATGNTIEDQG
jgi:hypothetical protein